MTEEIQEEEPTMEEKLEHADDKIDCLINLLIKKGIISQEEFQKEYDDMWEDSEQEE